MQSLRWVSWFGVMEDSQSAQLWQLILSLLLFAHLVYLDYKFNGAGTVSSDGYKQQQVQ